MIAKNIIAAVALSVVAGTLTAPVAASAATMIRGKAVETSQQAEQVHYYGYHYHYKPYYYYPKYRKHYYWGY
ncbi:MAG: hypothetical protein BroJett030_00810 [Alphaproteobacteria bacterium]|nr:MAG: hypothetical protein BroJett030_00810 [Alphaproteobacteria bacterium]